MLKFWLSRKVTMSNISVVKGYKHINVHMFQLHAIGFVQGGSGREIFTLHFSTCMEEKTCAYKHVAH